MGVRLIANRHTTQYVAVIRLLKGYPGIRSQMIMSKSKCLSKKGVILKVLLYYIILNYNLINSVLSKLLKKKFL